MSSESVCQVLRSWVGVGSFHIRLVVKFMIFTALVQNILDTPLYRLKMSNNFTYPKGSNYASKPAGGTGTPLCTSLHKHAFINNIVKGWKH
jgi:hypothetical protein